MQSLNMNGLVELESRLGILLKRWPQMKAAALKEMGEAALDIVRFNASVSGMKHDGGPIPGWQEYYIGSRLGYVAVRARGSTSGGGVGANSAGAITNYTENGHRIRRPSALKRDGYRYRPRVKVAAVRGYHYYDMSEEMARNAALTGAERLCREMAKALLEGGAA